MTARLVLGDADKSPGGVRSAALGQAERAADRAVVRMEVRLVGHVLDEPEPGRRAGGERALQACRSREPLGKFGAQRRCVAARPEDLRQSRGELVLRISAELGDRIDDEPGSLAVANGALQ